MERQRSGSLQLCHGLFEYWLVPYRSLLVPGVVRQPLKKLAVNENVLK
jgi:hypothetical protein